MSGPYKISVMFPAGKLGDHIRELATELALKRPQNWRVAEGHPEEGCPVLGLDLEDLLSLVELAKAEYREEAALPRSRYSFHDNLHEVAGSFIIDPVWLRDRRHADTEKLIEHQKAVLLRDLGASAAHGAAEVTEEQAPGGRGVLLGARMYAMSPRKELELRRYVRELEAWVAKYQVGPRPIIPPPI